MSIKDVRGVDLEVGQLVGFAERQGNIARMRTAEITAVDCDSGMVSVKWNDRYKLLGPIISTLHFEGELVGRPRFCVINQGV